MAATQSLMPGQANGFQFAPPQAKGTPNAVVQQYSGMPLDELVQEYMRNPSIQLLARIDEVRKQDQARAAVQGQLAQQQAQQQQGTVANETLMQAAQAAQPQQMPGMQGMPVRRMATGGIVALQSGGSSIAEPTYENPDFDEEGLPRGATEKAEIIARNRLRQQAYERARQGAPRSLMNVREMAQIQVPPEAIQRLKEFPPVGPRGGETAEDRAKVAARLAATDTAYPEPVGVREARRVTSDAAATSVPRSNPPRSNPPPAETPPAATSSQPDALAQAFAALNQAYQPPTISPEIQAARSRVSGIQALQEQQAMEDAKRIREEVVRMGQRRMDRANRPLLEDTQALAALMGSIDPTKGKLFGSLGTGLASVLAGKEVQREKAEDYITAGSDKVRQLNNTYRQLQLEQAKYQEALLSGDARTARESQEKLAALAYKYNVDREDLAVKRDVAKAQIAAAGAQAAAVPSRIDAATQGATARLAAVLNSDPILQGYRKRLEGALISPEDEAALLTKMRARERELLLQYAPELAALRQTAGAGTTGAPTARAEADKIIQGQQ